jgi:hypothetical protein
MRGFSFAHNDNSVVHQHFRSPKCATSHTFFGIAISIPGTTLRNVENWCRRAMHFVFLPELSVHWHRLPIGTKHQKIQRENRLDPRKTGIRHRFALEIGMSQATGVKEKPHVCGGHSYQSPGSLFSLILFLDRVICIFLNIPLFYVMNTFFVVSAVIGQIIIG